MKRKGFTLIELMVVIAIIIILAAIAIPNYLKMTERAKRSRVASDMATLATVLETFKTDWGAYPISSAAFQDLSSAATTVHIELAGIGAADTATTYNTWGSTNAVGEKNPAAGACIEYIKTGTLTSMINPWGQATNMMYGSNAGGNKWLLYMAVDAATWLVRTDASSTITTVTVLPVNPA